MHKSTAAMRLLANYFDRLLSLDTPTYTVAQITKRFEPSTVLWAFHTIQPVSHLVYFVCLVENRTRCFLLIAKFLSRFRDAYKQIYF